MRYEALIREVETGWNWSVTSVDDDAPLSDEVDRELDGPSGIRESQEEAEHAAYDAIEALRRERERLANAYRLTDTELAARYGENARASVQVGPQPVEVHEEIQVDEGDSFP